MGQLTILKAEFFADWVPKSSNMKNEILDSVEVSRCGLMAGSGEE